MADASFPSVTFVIPCYNHGKFVAEAVRSCLAQKDASIKVVIVDDGSNDGTTPQACDACVQLDPKRVVVIHTKNNGLSAARNRGAAEARTRGIDWAGHFLAFLDADDYIDETFVTKLHAAMLAAAGSSADDKSPSLGSPDRGAVSHAYCQERLVGLADMIWAVPDWDPILMMVTNLHPVTALIRRECFEAVGGFDESMRGGYEDWDLWLKFIEHGWRGTRVREPLFTWRRHSPVTMIVEAGLQHGRLFGQLVRNHPDLYRRHADELHIVANTLLRRGEGNWLDESGEAIVQRDTKKHLAWLTQDREAQLHTLELTRQHVRNIETELHAAHRTIAERNEREQALLAELAATRQQVNEAAATAAMRTQQIYETKPIVRLSKFVYRFLDHMPRPVKKMIRGTVHTVADAATPAASVKETTPHVRG